MSCISQIIGVWHADGFTKTWSSGAAFTNGIRTLGTSAGTLNASIYVMGNNGVDALDFGATFNGTSWSNFGTLPTINIGYCGGVGSSTDCLHGCGMSYSVWRTQTAKWNGSSWATFVPVLEGKVGYAIGGTSGSAAIGGGSVYADAPSMTTHNFNGTSWSASGNMVVAHAGTSGIGSATDLVAIGSYVTLATENYNGTTWATGAVLPQRRQWFTPVSGSSASHYIVITGQAESGALLTDMLHFDGVSFISSSGPISPRFGAKACSGVQARSSSISTWLVGGHPTSVGQASTTTEIYR
jgi:hypothetical protein